MKIGIIGGGQLARMMMLAGYSLGCEFRVLDPNADACAGQIGHQLIAAYDDAEAQQQLADWADVITFDFENVPEGALSGFTIPVYPSPQALAVAQDRLHEKTRFCHLNLPTPLFFPVESWVSLLVAVAQTGYPAILKTRTLGYDGKGQRFLRSPQDLYPAWRSLSGQPLILEEFIRFEREVSCIAVRGRTGETAFYPLTENHHHHGILRYSLAPFDAPNLTDQAHRHLQRLLDTLDYVGVLTVEFFVRDGQLIANEMAPRVHNSGHWTIEGAETSQFENHLRAICGLPLGKTTPKGFSAMVNCLGTMPAKSEILALPHSHVHDYGKAAREGRKVGHVTLNAPSRAELQSAFETLQHMLPIEG